MYFLFSKNKYSLCLISTHNMQKIGEKFLTNFIKLYNLQSSRYQPRHYQWPLALARKI